MSALPTASPPSLPSGRRRATAPALIALLLVAALASACSSGSGGSGSQGSRPSRSTTTSAGSPSTSLERPERTTTSESAAGGSTTTEDATTTTEEPTTTQEPTTTSEPETTTTRRTTTTRESTSTTAESTTTTVPATTTTVPVTGTDDSHAGWILLGVLAALLALLLAVAAARAARRRRWMAAGEAVLRDGRALVDLGSAGPAAAAPAQEVQHWDMIEQRAAALAAQLPAASSAATSSTDRSILAGLGTALDGYRGSVRTGRALRVGPPAPTAEQVQYADAEARQHLNGVAAELEQLDRVLAPDRKPS